MDEFAREPVVWSGESTPFPFACPARGQEKGSGAGGCAWASAGSPPSRLAVVDRCLVNRSMRLFLDALPSRLRFHEAARVLGVMPRELERAYARQGLHPRRHLREARLSGLHTDLQTARFATVAQAFARWGFPAASGDVIRDYRERYGGAPERVLALALESNSADPIVASTCDSARSFRWTDKPLKKGRVDPAKGWYGADHIGIDQGPILLRAANCLSDFVWKRMRGGPGIGKGLKLAGFTGG